MEVQEKAPGAGEEIRNDAKLNRDVWHSVFSLIVVSVLAFGFYPFAAWFSVAPVGTWVVFSTGLMLHIMASGMALLLFPVFLLLSIFKPSNRIFIYLVLLTLIIIILPIAGCNVTKDWQRNIRMAGMKAFTERMRPLVDSIHQYEIDKGAPPKILEQLVPEYLPEIPSTGMMGYQHLKYHARQIDPFDEYLYKENAWALTLYTPLAALNFDMMIYFPNQDYPEHAFGGSLEQVGNWSYLNE